MEEDLVSNPSEQSRAFNFPDADVVFRSSDGTLFHVHTRNLEFASHGFPPASIRPVDNEIVDLPEDSKVLELLFSFVYPSLLPDLKQVDFNDIYKVAEAVEKYEVHAGKKVCSLLMEQQASSHPIHVVNYAIKYGYPEIANSAAPHIRFHELKDQEWVTRDVLQLWMPYYYQWADAVQSTIRMMVNKDLDAHSNCGYPCSDWAEHLRSIIFALTSVSGPDWTIAELITITTEAHVNSCCKETAERFRTGLIEKLKKVPSFVKV